MDVTQFCANHKRQLSRRRLQQLARAAGHGRFAWDAERDATLTKCWSGSEPAELARLIGCSIRALYTRADALGLPPRNPVKRALRNGEAVPQPHRGITLASVPFDWRGEGVST